MAKFKHSRRNHHHCALIRRLSGLWLRKHTADVEHCISMPLMERDSHPERVVLLGQVGEDVGVEHSGLQEAAPQSSQLGAELAHVPADLLRYLLMAFLQLIGTEGGQKKRYSYNIKLNAFAQNTFCTILL